jgi:hypothetical protein
MRPVTQVPRAIPRREPGTSNGGPGSAWLATLELVIGEQLVTQLLNTRWQPLGRHLIEPRFHDLEQHSLPLTPELNRLGRSDSLERKHDLEAGVVFAQTLEQRRSREPRQLDRVLREGDAEVADSVRLDRHGDSVSCPQGPRPVRRLQPADPSRPGVEGAEVVGVVSIGDLVKFKSKQQSFEIQYLTDYITAG